MDNYVIKNMPQHNIADQKPVNINISFNINRKQVNQNMTAYQQQESLYLKSHLADPLNCTNIKNKNLNIKPPKTPQLALTERNLYNKDLSYLRTTQQMKRKKKCKKDSGDYTIDKTTFFPFYNQQMDRSLPNQNRGLTTALIKKPSNIKPKKNISSKGDETSRQNRMSILDTSNKGQVKSSMIQKNLKVMINKIISNELSKRSLPLPIVANKAKFNNSASLTNRKNSRTTQKKKSNKKLNKQKISNSMQDHLAYRNEQGLVNNKVSKQDAISHFNRKELIQKLSSFKSVQNSYLISQVDKSQQKQQNLISNNKNKRAIVIKTDQSIECIQQIQNYQRNRFKQDFFDKKEDQRTLHRRNQTQYLIQTYIKLLAQPSSQEQKQQQQLQQSQIRGRCNNNQQQYYQSNHLNSSDCFKLQQILKSQMNFKNNQSQNKQIFLRNQEKISEMTNIQKPKQIKIQQLQLEQKYRRNNKDIKKQIIKPQKQQAKNKIQKQDKSDYLNNNTENSKYNNQDQSQFTQFKPFISSQMGRQSFKNKNNQKNNYDGQIIEQQQRKKLNQLKKQQIQKWGYLLEFIKDNMNKQTDTQTVLQTVYKYLEKAKVDLIKQGNQSLLNSKNNKSRQIQQFTNKLSSQYEKSSKDYYNQQSNKQSSKLNDQRYQKSNKQFNSQQLYSKQHLVNNFMKSVQNKQQIDQQILSFKQDYSQQDDQQIKYMNLQTIDSALKNRFNVLNQRKVKQLTILQQKFQSNKINQQQFQVQKQKILKWIKKQTDQIIKVKKNIWKGYNQARGILDKSYLNTKCIEEKSAQKKMMKCLSQTYLSNRRMDYKKYIEEQIKKQEQKQNQNVQYQSQSEQNNSNQNQQQSQRQDQQSQNQIQDYDHQNIDYQHEQQSNQEEEKKQEEGQNIRLTQKNKIQEIKKYIKNSCSTISPQNAQKITNENQQILQSQLLEKYKNQIEDQVQNQFSAPQYSKSKIQSQNKSSPSSQKSNPISPSSIHYQQLEQQIHSSDDQMNYYDNFDNDSKQHSQTNLSRQQLSDQQQKQIIQKQLNLTPKIGQKKIKKEVKKQNKQSIQIQKLKYITAEDKQDIFEFLFLDLCIQLYQQPCKDNKFMNTINKHIEKMYQLSKRKKGVKTNLNVVKDYLKRFCGYVLRTNKKALENLQVPMGPTAIQMLKYMHENDDIEDEPLDQGQQIVTLIVPIQSFDVFQRSLLPTLQFQKYYEDQQKQNQRVNFLKNILHIHNKALFDALNQFLDQQRPFGIWGKPFPWKKASSFSHKLNDIQIQEKLKKSAQKVVQACSYVCGLLVDKQQSLVANAKVSQAYIQQIRQDRISRMLANDMIQNQQRWVFYDDQQTQVLVQAGNTIYNQLVQQFIQDYVFLMNRQIQI